MGMVALVVDLVTGMVEVEESRWLAKQKSLSGLNLFDYLVVF